MRITVYFTMRFALRLASLSRHPLCYVGGWGWRRRLQRRGLWGRRFRIGMPGPLLLVLTQLVAVFTSKLFLMLLLLALYVVMMGLTTMFPTAV